MTEMIFKLNAKKMFGKLGRTKFRRATRRWATKTALMLEHEAKNRAPVGGSGFLHDSIHHRVLEKGDNIIARTGSNLKYAVYQEFGTGIHGPRKRLIRPRRKKQLAWQKPGGEWVYAMFSRGVKARKYFARALKAEKPRAYQRLDTELKREMEMA